MLHHFRAPENVTMSLICLQLSLSLIPQSKTFTPKTDLRLSFMSFWKVSRSYALTARIYLAFIL